MSNETQKVDVLAVGAYLSFDRSKLNFRGQPGLKIGNGEAGYSVFRFNNASEALDFATRLAPESRMPSHDCAVASIKDAMVNGGEQ